MNYCYRTCSNYYFVFFTSFVSFFVQINEKCALFLQCFETQRTRSYLLLFPYKNHNNNSDSQQLVKKWNKFPSKLIKSKESRNICGKTTWIHSKTKLDLPECERKLAKNFMIGHVVWIYKHNAAQWFHLPFSAYDVARSQIQC